jgi:hypothetical protein
VKTLVKRINTVKKRVSIDLPADFVNKDIRVIIQLNNHKAEKLLMTDKIKIDTKKWKFKRDDIY